MSFYPNDNSSSFGGLPSQPAASPVKSRTTSPTKDSSNIAASEKAEESESLYKVTSARRPLPSTTNRRSYTSTREITGNPSLSGSLIPPVPPLPTSHSRNDHLHRDRQRIDTPTHNFKRPSTAPAPLTRPPSSLSNTPTSPLATGTSTTGSPGLSVQPQKFSSGENSTKNTPSRPNPRLRHFGSAQTLTSFFPPSVANAFSTTNPSNVNMSSVGGKQRAPMSQVLKKISIGEGNSQGGRNGAMGPSASPNGRSRSSSRPGRIRKGHGAQVKCNSLGAGGIGCTSSSEQEHEQRWWKCDSCPFTLCDKCMNSIPYPSTLWSSLHPQHPKTNFYELHPSRSTQDNSAPFSNLAPSPPSTRQRTKSSPSHPAPLVPGGPIVPPASLAASMSSTLISSQQHHPRSQSHSTLVQSQAYPVSAYASSAALSSRPRLISQQTAPAQVPGVARSEPQPVISVVRASNASTRSHAPSSSVPTSMNAAAVTAARDSEDWRTRGQKERERWMIMIGDGKKSAWDGRTSHEEKKSTFGDQAGVNPTPAPSSTKLEKEMEWLKQGNRSEQKKRKPTVSGEEMLAAMERPLRLISQRDLEDDEDGGTLGPMRRPNLGEADWNQLQEMERRLRMGNMSGHERSETEATLPPYEPPTSPQGQQVETATSRSSFLSSSSRKSLDSDRPRSSTSSKMSSDISTAPTSARLSSHDISGDHRAAFIAYHGPKNEQERHPSFHSESSRPQSIVTIEELSKRMAKNRESIGEMSRPGTGEGVLERMNSKDSTTAVIDGGRRRRRQAWCYEEVEELLQFPPPPDSESSGDNAQHFSPRHPVSISYLPPTSQSIDHVLANVHAPVHSIPSNEPTPMSSKPVTSKPRLPSLDIGSSLDFSALNVGKSPSKAVSSSKTFDPNVPLPSPGVTSPKSTRISSLDMPETPVSSSSSLASIKSSLEFPHSDIPNSSASPRDLPATPQSAKKSASLKSTKSSLKMEDALSFPMSPNISPTPSVPSTTSVSPIHSPPSLLGSPSSSISPAPAPPPSSTVTSGKREDSQDTIKFSDVSSGASIPMVASVNHADGLTFQHRKPTSPDESFSSSVGTTTSSLFSLPSSSSTAATPDIESSSNQSEKMAPSVSSSTTSGIKKLDIQSIGSPSPITSPVSPASDSNVASSRRGTRRPLPKIPGSTSTYSRTASQSTTPVHTPPVPGTISPTSPYNNKAQPLHSPTLVMGNSVNASGGYFFPMGGYHNLPPRPAASKDHGGGGGSFTAHMQGQMQQMEMSTGMVQHPLPFPGTNMNPNDPGMVISGNNIPSAHGGFSTSHR